MATKHEHEGIRTKNIHHLVQTRESYPEAKQMMNLEADHSICTQPEGNLDRGTLVSNYILNHEFCLEECELDNEDKLSSYIKKCERENPHPGNSVSYAAAGDKNSSSSRSAFEEALDKYEPNDVDLIRSIHSTEIGAEAAKEDTELDTSSDGYSMGSGRLTNLGALSEDEEASNASDEIPSLHDDEDEDDFDLFELMDLGDPWENEPAVPQYPCNKESLDECSICTEETLLRRRICCDYPACDSCFEKYLVGLINEAVVKVECPACNSYIHRDEILHRLPFDVKEKYYKFLVDANKDPFIKTCPRCSFIHKLDKDNSSHVTMVTKNRRKQTVPVICPSCNLEWCFPCQAPWHEGATCKEFSKGDKMLKTWASDLHYGLKNAQKCPRCKVFINKKGGCNHMTCCQCNTNFCYQCGKRHHSLKWFGNHSDRLSPFGCKFNFMPDKPATRRLIRGSLAGVKILAGIGLLGLAVAAGAIVLASGIVILPGYGAYRYHKYRKIRKTRKRIRIEDRQLASAIATSLEIRHIPDSAVSTQLELPDDIFEDVYQMDLPEVEVVVHAPDQLEIALQGFGETSDARVVSKDDQGRETVTSAELSETVGIGGVPEVILQVKTSYAEDKKPSTSSTETPSYLPYVEGKENEDAGRQTDSCEDALTEVTEIKDPLQSGGGSPVDMEIVPDRAQADTNGCFIRLFSKHKIIEKEDAVLLAYRPLQQPDVISSALQVEQQKMKIHTEKLKDKVTSANTSKTGFLVTSV